MRWSDLAFKITTDGKKYLEFYERETKTRKGQIGQKPRSYDTQGQVSSINFASLAPASAWPSLA